MTIEVSKSAGPPKPLSGRPSVYPYTTMEIGEFFFLPGRTVNHVTSHASERGRVLGRRFATRLQWMRRTPQGWESASEGDTGAVRGVGVYRVE